MGNFLSDAWNYGQNLLVGGDATKNLDVGVRNYDAATGQLGDIARGAGSRAAPAATAARLGGPYQLAGGPQDQARAGMLGVADRLGAIAGGQAPGAGELAVNRQLGSATAAQIAAARTARGANAALAFRNAARNTADLGLAGAGQAAQAQMQDQAAANQQLGALYGGMRGQDIDVAAQNAQLGQQQMLQQGAFDQQAAIANLQAQLAQTGMNDAQQIQALGQMLGWDQARINAELAKVNAKMQDKGILPGLIQAGGQIAASYATGGLSNVAQAPRPPQTYGNNLMPLGAA